MSGLKETNTYLIKEDNSFMQKQQTFIKKYRNEIIVGIIVFLVLISLSLNFWNSSITELIIYYNNIHSILKN